MSYRFELREQIAPAFSRIATEQIDRVQRDFTTPKNRSEAVHEGRKSLKRLRALLRLVRPGIGDATFKTENARFRDIGALFSADRDRFVLKDVAEKQAVAMGARYRRPFAAIVATLTAPTASKPAGASLEKDAVARLAEARKALADLHVEPNAFEALQAGLKISYRRGRHHLRQAYENPTDEGFHDLRKAVQQHWRHMQVLQRAWPDLFGARLNAARELSQILGDDHDLAVFIHYLRTLPRKALSTLDRRAIERHCRAEQHRLRVQAHPLCQRLYAERAGRFAKRISAIWHAAVRLEETLEAAKPRARRPAKARPAKKPPARRGNSAQSARQTT